MHCVYWLEAGEARHRMFASASLGEALAWAEALRARRRGGAPVGWVTIASEDPGHVGEAGVADPRADYDWVKRRAPRRRDAG